MKITVRNLGAIKEAELDLKPLTILIGPNNAGKTWLAYTLAGIFGEYGWYRYVRGDRAEEVAKLYPSLIQAVDKIMVKGTARIDLLRLAQECGEAYFNAIAQYAHEWLPDFMNTYLADFKNVAISIGLDNAKSAFLDNILSDHLHVAIGTSGGGSEAKSMFRVQKKQKNRNVYLYTMSEGLVEEELPREIIEESLVRNLLRIFHHALYPDIVVLPTERSTIITEPLSVVMELSLLSKNKKMREDPAVSDIDSFMSKRIASTNPVVGYQEFAKKVLVCGSKEKVDRAKLAEQLPQVQEYMDLARLLEQEILGGRLDFSTPEPEPMREIYFKQDGVGHPLEVSVASSMVKELTSLVFYLRYFARPGELLVIDEPEINLHPEAQVKVIEFLAMLVNAGLHVLVTTHSPYIVDHLINLMEAKKRSNQDEIADLFFLKHIGAFIAQEMVSANLVDNGTIKSILDEGGIIHWSTFSKVTRQVDNIHFNL